MTMGKARLTFLGTGTSQGVPMIGCGCDVCRSLDERDKRLRASVFIEYEGLQILVDAGPDFRQQMLRQQGQLRSGGRFRSGWRPPDRDQMRRGSDSEWTGWGARLRPVFG